jgi:hypothetical protein
MTIQKKSLISTLKTAKKANVASAPLAHVEGGTAEKQVGKASGVKLMAKTYGKRLAARYAKR